MLQGTYLHEKEITEGPSEIRTLLGSLPPAPLSGFKGQQEMKMMS